MTLSEEAVPVVSVPSGADPAADTGLQRLRAEAQLLAGRIRRVSPLRLTLMAASVTVPLGFTVILLAWHGASRVPREIQQNPYVISGGLGGVALVFLGGLLFIAFAVTRAAEEQRARDDANAALLRELISQFSIARPEPTTDVQGRGTVPALVTTGRGKMAHRPDCALLGTAVSVHPVTDPSGMDACRLCQPDVPAGREGRRAERARRSSR